MGYDIHITRREDWADHDSGPAISREEFERVVLGDPRFVKSDELGPDYAVWRSRAKGTPSPDAGGEWVCWSDGELQSKNSSPAFLEVLVELAATLDARAEGDDGEHYGATEESLGAETSKGPDGGQWMWVMWVCQFISIGLVLGVVALGVMWIAGLL